MVSVIACLVRRSKLSLAHGGDEPADAHRTLEVSSYELDVLVADPTKRVLRIVARGNGRFAVTWTAAEPP